MESEIAHLESIIRERDEQLSSFKNVLDEKETKLRKQEEMASQLSAQLGALDELCQSKDCQIKNLDSELAEKSRDVVGLGAKVDSLLSSLDEAASHGKELEGEVTKKNSRLDQLEAEIESTRVARVKMEQELASRSEEVNSLSHFIDTQKELIKEKEGEILRMVDEIEALQISVHSSNDSLRQTVQGSEEAAKILESNSRKIQEFEQEVQELRDRLVRERANVDQAKVVSGELEKELVMARGSLKEMETRQREMEDLNLSFSSHQEKTELEMRDLEQKLENLHESEEAMAELGNLKQLYTDKEKAFERLERERENFSSRFSELQSQAAQLSGALELTQQEVSGKECTIKTLSEALELKKTALAAIDREMTQAMAEHAEKLKESLQYSEQSVQAMAALEEVKTELVRKEIELKQARGEMEDSRKERSVLSTEFDIVVTKLKVLEREKEASKVESETLRGQVECLSGERTSLSQEQSKHKDTLADLSAELARRSDQMKELESNFQTARKRISDVTAERDEGTKKREEMNAELARNAKENKQMKYQFDSAVKLMDSKLSAQASATSRLTGELEMKGRTIASLREQLTADSRKSSELMEKVMKVSADYKVSSDRCRLLENEKADLQRTVRELTTNNSHLEHTYSETMSEREVIRSECEAALNGMQEHEARVLTITQQLAHVAREKHAAEDQLREMSKQLLSSEQEKLSLSAKLEGLQEKVHRAKDLDKEKMVS